MQLAEHDVFGFFETLVEYYTGQPASNLTDAQLAFKVSHISKLRKLEGDSQIEELVQKIIR